MSICIISILSPLLLQGHAAVAMTNDQWQKLTSDKAFSYRTEVEPVKQITANKSNWLQHLFASIFSFFSGEMGTILLWMVVCGVLLYLLYKVVTNSGGALFGKRQKKLTDDQAEESEDITATNWEALMQNAAASNDIRGAVRYSYMWLLQLLQERELIRYRTDKTNYEYAGELAATTYKQPFRQLSRQYEYAWYGGYALSPSDYNGYMQLFNELRKQLDR